MTQHAATIIIADDHPLFRNALSEAICAHMPACEIVSAADFDEADTAIAANSDADLLLLDLTMPGANGFAGLMRLRAEYPALPIIMVSASEDPATIRRAMNLDASGFIPKSSSMETIRTAIAQVLEGGVFVPQGISLDEDEDDEVSDMLARLAKLTPQQNRVLNMLAEGLLNKQIAYELSVSEATVKAHVSAVLTKLSVDSRTQAVIMLSKIAELSRNPAPE